MTTTMQEDYTPTFTQEQAESLELHFAIGKRDRKRIPVTVSVMQNQKYTQFSEECPVYFVTDRKPFYDHKFYLQVRHYIGLDNHIEKETTSELFTQNTEDPPTIRFASGVGRFFMRHEVTRREVAAAWNLKEPRRVNMWLSIALCSRNIILCEFGPQEIVFKNGAQKDELSLKKSKSKRRSYSDDEEEEEEEESQKVKEERTYPAAAKSPIPKPSTPTINTQVPVKDMKPNVMLTPGNPVPSKKPVATPTPTYAPIETPNQYVETLRQAPATPRAIMHRRNLAIDSLIHYSTQLRIPDIQLETAVHYMDQFITATMYQGSLSTLSIVCLCLSVQHLQDVTMAPGIEEFIRFAGCSAEQFGHLHLQVSSILGNNIPLTARYFLKKYVILLRADSTVSALANFFCEMALLDSISSRYLPSVVASASLYLSLFLQGQEETISMLERFQPELVCSMQDPCVQELFAFCKESSLAYQALYVKYACLLPLCELPVNPMSPEHSPL